MSTFKKPLENKKDKPQIDYSKFSKIKKSDFEDFQDLVEQNAGLSFEKQMIFADVIGDNDWEIDLEKGNISFGNIIFSIQVIGSLSFETNSWMWGWENTQSEIPENLLIQSNKLRETGKQKNIEELKEGHFNTKDPDFDHKIGMIASGVFKSKSYYSANFGSGALVVTIDDDRIPEIDKKILKKVLRSFPQLISSIELKNHKNAFKNYLIDRDFEQNISENKIEGLKDSKVLIAEFDGQNRLKSLNGKI